jgi:curved DNA-binding protein CbpA
MALKNYYVTLGLLPFASFEEIKMAYRNKAIEWHPDRNPNRDTTLQMQEINEAYLVLKSDKKAMYDREYLKHYGRSHHAATPDKAGSNTEINIDSDFETEAREFREQAIEYTKKSLSEILDLLAVGGKAFKKSLLRSFWSYVLLILIINFIILMCKK